MIQRPEGPMAETKKKKQGRQPSKSLAPRIAEANGELGKRVRIEQ